MLIQLLRPLLLLTFTAVISSCHTIAAESTGDPGDAAKLQVTIGNGTTYITEPLGRDGYPDYVAAINERLSRGVTPENNAMALLVRVLGRGELEDDTAPLYFGLLGVDPSPRDGDYLVDRSKLARRWHREHFVSDLTVDWERLYSQFDTARSRPWSAQELPMVAEWLKVNEKHLDPIREATGRPRFYSPWVNSAPGARMFAMPLPYVDGIREAAVLLAVSAMHRVHEGDDWALRPVAVQRDD